MAEQTELRAQLESEQARLERDLEALAGEARSSEGRETSSYATHVADEGTETFDEEREQALARHIEGALAQVRRALHKLELGTYGQCDSCGRQIDAERLQALPQATTCLACRRQAEGTR